MRYRISGETTDGKTFTSRVEAANAIAAVGTFRTMLAEGGKTDADVAIIRAKASAGKSSISFGEKRERKPKTAPPAAPAKPAAAPARK